jgi:hypothetical protein
MFVVTFVAFVPPVFVVVAAIVVVSLLHVAVFAAVVLG